MAGKSGRHQGKKHQGKHRPADPRTRWILWGAMVNALLFFAIIGYVIRSQGETPPADPNTLWLMTLSLGVVAALVSAFHLFGVKRLTKNTSPAAYTTALVLRLALGEAVGIFGFLLFFLGASWTVFLAFLGWALLLHLSAMPTGGNIEQYER